MSAFQASSAASASIDIEDCPICQESYTAGADNSRVPKILPCGHTFCLQCCEGLLRNAHNTPPQHGLHGQQPPLFANPSVTISCPKCREQIRLPRANALASLKTNYFAQDVVQQQMTGTGSVVKVQCASCKKMTPDDEMFLCQTCVTGGMPRNEDKICSACAIRKHNGHTLTDMMQYTQQLLTTQQTLHTLSEEAQQALQLFQQETTNQFQQHLQDIMQTSRCYVDTLFGAVNRGAETMTVQGLDEAVTQQCVAGCKQQLSSSLTEPLDKHYQLVQEMPHPLNQPIIGQRQPQPSTSAQNQPMNATELSGPSTSRDVHVFTATASTAAPPPRSTTKARRHKLIFTPKTESE